MLYKIFIINLLICSFFISAAQAQSDITIAVVGAMSGQFEGVGSEFKQGVRGAVEDINASGGLNGKKIIVIDRDDECNPEKAVTIAKELVNIRVALVVGHLCSGASIAASEIYSKQSIIQISPASTAPNFTERGLDNVFRTCGRDDMQGFVIAEHIVRKYPLKKVGIGYDESTYSFGLATLTKKFLNKNGIKEDFFIKLPSNETDFSSVLEKISKNKVDVLFFPSYAASATQILKQAKKMKVEFQFVGSDTLMNDDFLNLAGDLTEGVEISFPPDPSHDRRNRKLVRKYKKKGLNPEAFTFYSYAAVQVWAQAAQKANTISGDKVINSLKTSDFNTVLGKVTFNKNGDISQPGFVMYGFFNGEADYLQ